MLLSLRKKRLTSLFKEVRVFKVGPGPESALRSAFLAILGTCLGVPQRVLFECFLAFFGPKNAKKHSKSTLWGTPRQVPKIAQKALRGALSGPGPKSTPVNGGRDRNANGQEQLSFLALVKRRDGREAKRADI